MALASSDASTLYKRLMTTVVGALTVIALAELGVVITLAVRLANENDDNEMRSDSVIQLVTTTALPDIVINTGGGFSAKRGSTSSSAVVVEEVKFATTSPPDGPNICEGQTPEDVTNVQCIVNAMVNVGPQAGANVTKGYVGGLETESVPLTTPFWQNGLCPVNVHFHLGAEHYSVGQYDEFGTGPPPKEEGEMEEEEEDEGERLRRLQEKGEDYPSGQGYRCRHYEADDAKFTMPYNFQHCVDVQVGETYEVHWPQSVAGACGTPNQYQTPFTDGVFCRDGVLDLTSPLSFQVGVQAQVFTIVNDEAYYYPNLIAGMIVDGVYGKDIAAYTGSTTGTSVSNEICSSYSPITWQVDRQCQLISASSFDKMCADMKAQRDDLTEELEPQGSRVLVDDRLSANNQVSIGAAAATPMVSEEGSTGEDGGRRFLRIVL